MYKDDDRLEDALRRAEAGQDLQEAGPAASPESGELGVCTAPNVSPVLG